MEDHAFEVGQEFPDVKAFRNAIKEAAIAQHFELRIVKSDLVRYFAKCAAENCPWRIRAVKLPRSPTFTIRSLEATHTCGKNAQNGHHQASVDWIVSFIEERLRGNVNYKPKDILHDIQAQYGITLPYKQAWRAKERGMATIYGSSEEGYCLLPAFCEEIKRTNPGSFAEVYTVGTDNRFHRLFVSFYMSVHGFLSGCLPLVCLGATQLRSKYLGTLLSACSFDGNGGLFPLAFAVVDVESDENWDWFLSEIHKALVTLTEEMPRFTFLSGVQKGIIDAVRTRFPGSAQAFCVRHLSETIGKEFKNPRLVNLVRKAAYAATVSGFKEKMGEIEELSPGAAEWLRELQPPRWALVHFEGTCYGHLSSNIEELNKWIDDALDLPVVQVIDRIQNMLMIEFEERRVESSSWSSTLAPSAEARIVESIRPASSYQVLRSDEVEFEVLSADRSDIVNIGARSCSCRDWQHHGIPCSHAAAALISCQKDVYTFAEKCFTTASYREAYTGRMHPVTGPIEWRKTACDGSQTVRPPKCRRPPGRPEKKRVCVEEVNREKHTVHCSRCNQTGHYKTTCKAEVIERIKQF